MIQPATSLLIETGKHTNLSEIQQTLLQQFIKDLTLYKEQGFDPFVAELKRYT